MQAGETNNYGAIIINKSYPLGAVCACVFSLGLVSTANAALVSRLGGLAYYDDVADLTWLADANAGAGSVFDDGTSTSDGIMSWANANAWAASLIVSGVIGWRLPVTPQTDDGCTVQRPQVPDSYGYSCTDSEMGNLYYNVLGGEAGAQLPLVHNSNYDLFSNVQPHNYWSATEAAAFPGNAWDFTFSVGYQFVRTKPTGAFAWPVFDGDVLITLLRCDLNNNSEVDAGDLAQVVRMVFDNIADDLDCDINNGGFGDGAITTADLAILYRIVLGIIPEIYN